MKSTFNTYSTLSESLRQEGINGSELRELEALWQAIPEFPVVADNGKGDVRNTVLNAITPVQASHLRLQRPVARIFNLRFSLVNVAAAIVVALGFLLSPSGQHIRTLPGVVSTPITLPDGSSVVLASGSRLSFADDFGANQRTVILHGEALFEVEKGSTPFVVNTFDASTTVLGTTFNVNAWPGSVNASTKVAVTSGRVSVAESHETHEVIVVPGQMVSVNTNELSVETSDVSKIVSWTEGGFHFINEPISNVLDEIERRFDVKIVAPSSIQHRTVSYSTTNSSTASEVVGDIAAGISVRYRPISNGFELYLN